MNTEPMSGPAGEARMARLREVLAAYGADPARWPWAERALAEELSRHPALVAEALAEAQAVDRLLGALPAIAPSQALRARILAETPRVAAGLGSGRGAGVSAGGGGWGLAGLGDALAALAGRGLALARAVPVIVAAGALGLTTGLMSPEGVLDGLGADNSGEAEVLLLAFNAGGLEGEGADWIEGAGTP